MNKSIMCCILLLCANLGLLAQSATPPAAGDGSSSNPYQIANLENLYWIAANTANWNKHYIQTANINAAATNTWFSGQGWTPIGNNSTKFTGTYNGGGFSITGLFINRPTTLYQGLFGFISNSTVKNLTLYSLEINGGQQTGGLTGRADNSNLERVNVSGQISSTSDYIGGMIGYAAGSQFHYLSSNVTVTGNSYVGGLIGWNSSGNGIRHCRTEGSVNGGSQVGGLAGLCTSNISDCYSHASVNGSSHVGGLVGYQQSQSVYRSYSSGLVSGTGSGFGGFFGSANTTAWHCYWDTEASGRTSSAGGAGVVGKTTTEMKQQATYPQFNFETLWQINEGNSYPAIQDLSVYNYTPPVMIDLSTLSGTGTVNDPYIITNASELHSMRQNLAAHYKQGSDIDLSNSLVWEYGRGWNTIGTYSPNAPFTGSFDGNGYTITGLNINKPNIDYQGLFGWVNNATIKNVHLQNAKVQCNQHSGLLVGSSNNSNHEGSAVEGFIVSAGSNIGGMIGYASGSQFHYLSSNVIVIGNSSVGGLIGYTSSGNGIRHCWSEGSVHGGSQVGGLAGLCTSNISDCYSHASVNGTSSVGGLVGYQQSQSVYRSYSSGLVSGTGSGFGGFFGMANTTAWHCYWDTEASGRTSSAGGAGVVGKTTTEMKQQTTYPQYNFYTLWEIDEGNSYPVFQDLGSYDFTSPVVVELSTLSGAGTIEDPYILTNASELYSIRQNLAAHYKLANDIDLSNSIVWFYGRGWWRIGTDAASERFTGSLNGDGHNIIGMHINRPNHGYHGLFAYLSNASVYDLNFENAIVHGGQFTGILSGYSSNSGIENTHVNGWVISSNDQTGGIIGDVSGGLLTNLSADIYVSGGAPYNTGGICGALRNGAQLQYAFSRGEVRGVSSVGGLVGAIHSSNDLIQDSYSRANVYSTTTSDAVGGILGWRGGGNILRSYATGLVDGPGPYGGLVGYGIGNFVTDSYWNFETSGRASSAGGAGALGRTTEQMTYPYAANTYQNWDFTDVWQADVSSAMNDGYPYFVGQIVSLPKVITSVISGITQTTATGGGQVTAAGGAEVSARGLVWGLSANPTLENNLGFTVDSSGIGSYTSIITGLQPFTNYIVRSYATNSAGTAYGNQRNFKTLAGASCSGNLYFYPSHPILDLSEFVTPPGGIFSGEHLIIQENSFLFDPATGIGQYPFQYCFTTTDYTDCCQLTIHIVDSLRIVASAVQPVICTGSNTQLLATPSGGSGSYTYSWSSNPPGFSSTQRNPSVSPTVNTTYTVVVNDGFHTATASTSIETWDGNPPSTPISLLPADSTFNLQQPITFSWSDVQDASSYNLYIWRSNQNKPSTPTISGLTETNHVHTDYLNTSYMYNWQVVAVNICGQSPGEIRSFAFNPFSDLTVTSIELPAEALSGSQLTVSFNVANVGEGETGMTPWKDRVYLSESPEFTLANSTLMGTYNQLSNLNFGESYSSEVSFGLSNYLEGAYYIYVVTDAFNTIQEINENNNVRRSENPVIVSLAPYPDIAVSNVVSIGGNIIPGEQISVSWNVQNLGDANAVGGWSQRVAIISGSQMQVLGYVQTSDPLEVSGIISLNASFNVPQSQGFDGEVFIQVRLTPNAALIEKPNATENNTALSNQSYMLEQRIFVVLPQSSLSENATAPLHCMVNRSGNRTTAQVINLSVSEADRITMPGSVTIPANQTGAAFQISAIDNAVIGGNIPLTITATAGDYPDATAILTIIDDEVPSLSISLDKSSAYEGESFQLTVTRDFITDSQLTVGLTTNKPNQIELPTSIIIPANEANASLTIPIVNNNIPELDELVNIDISAVGFVPASAGITILDDDMPQLSFSINPATVSESGGPHAAWGLVSLSEPASIAVTVRITADISGQVYFPTTIMIPAGQMQKQFNIGVVDNGLLDGDREVAITAAVYLSTCSCGAPAESGGAATRQLSIIDNDGPSQNVSANPYVVPENTNNGGAITITRNTIGGPQLTVNIQHNGPNEISLPATATIPEGSTSVTVPFSTLDDGIEDGDQTVTIIVSAQDYSQGSCWLIVSDRNLPDYSAGSLSISNNSVYINDKLDITFQVLNKGFALAPNGSEVKFYLSRNAQLDNSDHLIATQYTQFSVNSGDSTKIEAEFIPTTAVGDFYIIATVNANGAMNELIAINNTSEATPLTILPDYKATANVNGDVFNGTTPITITGITETILKDAVPNREVDVYIVVNGSRRVLKATSDANGDFAIDFLPLNGEAGEYYVGACYPGQELNEAQDEFTILGAKHTASGFILWDVWLNETKTFELEIENISELKLNNVQIQTSELPTGCSVNFTPISSIPGKSKTTLNYTVTGNSVTSGSSYKEVKLKLVSAQGTIFTFSTWFFCRATRGNMKISPASLSKAMVRGSSNVAEFEIMNNGMDETGIINVLLPQNNWMTTASPIPVPSLQPGQKAIVTLRLTPGEDLQLNNPVNGQIALSASNANGVAIPFTFEPVSTETGNLLVDVVDEYTYNTTAAPHVANAKVKITHPYTGQLIAQGTTNADGHFLAEGINEGFYKLNVQADKHEGYQNIIYVEKGTTKTQVVFIAFQAITYSWQVVPTMIEDQYEMTLVTVFETNVPAPVVTMHMPDSMPQLNYGEIFPFMITLANHGLITANNVEINFPDDPEYDFVANVHTINILPNTSVQIPAIMQRKDPAKSDGKNTDCDAYVVGKFEFVCGDDGQYRIIMTKIYYEGRNCGSGYRPPGIIFKPISSPPQGDPYNISNTFPAQAMTVPLEQSNVGCDPCIAMLMNAVWGCLPLPKIIALSSKGIISYGLAMGLYKYYKKAKCAHELASSIYCFFDEDENYNGKNQVPEELIQAQEDMFIADIGIAAVANLSLEFYNEELLIEREAFGLLNDSLSNNFDNNLPITAQRLNQLLVAFSATDIPAEEITAFSERWNSTLVAWGMGIYTPTPAHPNIIDTVMIYNYKADLDSANNYALQRGFDSLEELYNNAYEIINNYTEQKQTAVCASVTVQFSQTMTMTREAFEGTLTIFNGHDTDAMQNIQLQLEVRDEEGFIKNDLFQINTQSVSILTAIDGTGTLDAQAKGTAVILFIPERGAAPEVPRYYSFGGKLSYTDPFTGEFFEQILLPVTLQVNPSPDLHIDYFMQRDILGDDALTTPVEPSIPAELAVMIENKGAGTAWSVNIESAKPTIIENEKGLLIDFDIIGSNLGGQPKQLGLLNVDFGHIPGGDIAVGQWWFTSSLLGHFVSYEVSVNHLNSFGNPDLSLVSSVDIHELIKSIRVYGSLDDSICDFLVNDIPDVEDIPDALYLSNGMVAPVYLADTSATDGTVSMSNLSVQLMVEPSSEGWNYTKLNDPGDGQFKIISCIREDGQLIPLENIWLSFVRIPDGGEPIYENKLHFIDDFPSLDALNYTIEFAPINQDIPAVIAINGIPEGIADSPVTNAEVVFNKPIDPLSFNHEDMILRNQGGPNLMDSLVIISQINDTIFDLDLSSKTNSEGFYALTINTTGITDLSGNAGQMGSQATWIQSFNKPLISMFLGAPEPFGNPIDTLLVYFNMPINVSTFTNEQLILHIVDGDTLSTANISIASANQMGNVFRLSGLLPMTTENATYQLTVKVTEITGENGENGISDQSIQWTVFVETFPTLDAGSDDTICENQTYQLAATATDYNSLQWTTSGDGNFSNAAILDPVYTPGVSDIANESVELCLQASSTSGNNVSSDCMILNIMTKPDIVCMDDFSIEISQNALLLNGATPPGGIYSGNGIVDNSFDPQIAGIGTHEITYTYTDTCSVQSCIFTIDVIEDQPACQDAAINNLPVINDFCHNSIQEIDFSSVLFEHTTEVIWEISPPEAASFANKVLYLESDFTGFVSIQIIAVAEAPCQTAFASVEFTVFPVEQAEIFGNTTLCEGNSILLTATSGAEAYLWNTGDTTISIIVTEAGIYSVILTDENGCQSSAETEIFVLPLLEITTAEAVNISENSATSGGTITDFCGQTVSQRGLVWSLSENPDLVSNDGFTNDGEGTGAFTSNLINLIPATTYYARAYAVSEEGTAYGMQITFTTLNSVTTPVVPTLSTLTPYDITSDAAMSGGDISSDGGDEVTARGVVWSTTQSPTVELNIGMTADGSGDGPFTSSLTGLSPSTAYYVRAYATNSVGTAYGDELVFLTLSTNMFVCGTSTITDIDGNIYNTVLIGSQCWTKENLKVTRDANGNPISRLCYETTNNCNHYGGLYSWTTSINGSNGTNGKSHQQGICPVGWHVPSQSEWQQLLTLLHFAGHQNYNHPNGPGNALKSCRQQDSPLDGECNTNEHPYWQSHTTFGFDAYGFSALPGGRGWGNGYFNELGYQANFWSSSEYGPTNATRVTISYDSGNLGIGEWSREMEYSVRCVKNEVYAMLPLVLTYSVNNIASTTATCSGYIPYDGGAAISARGVVWSTSQNPSIENHDGITTDGTGIGDFTSSITGLLPATSYYLKAYATNSVGTAYGEEINFTTLSAVELPTLTTADVDNITSTTAISGGDISSDGGDEVTARGVVWSTTQSPTVELNIGKTADGSGDGPFTSSLTELSPSTAYYVRAYATNSAGTAYGEEINFTTLSAVELPTLTTADVDNITSTTAMSGGDISSDGGDEVTERGVVWSTTQSPTVELNIGMTTDGSGDGMFTSSLTGLNPSTAYYVRAYATNSAGTAYGESLLFTTLSQNSGGSATFEPGPLMNTPRMHHNAVTLPDGRAGFFGGHTTNFIALKSAEIWTPGETSPISYTMNYFHSWPAFVLLNDGSYLLAGGCANIGVPSYSSSEIFKPANNAFIPVGNMVRYRSSMNSGGAALTDGSAFIAGGWWTHNNAHTYGEHYNPSSQTFTEVGPFTLARSHNIVMPTADGKAVVMGGGSPNGSAIQQILELYDPSDGSISSLQNELFNDETAWSVRSNFRPTGKQKMANGKFIWLAGKSINSVSYYRLLVFDPVTKEITHLETDPPLPNSSEIAGYFGHPIVDNARNMVHLIAITSNNPYPNLIVYSIELATGQLLELSKTYNPGYYLYGSDNNLMHDGRILVSGGSANNNNYSPVRNTFFIDLDFENISPPATYTLNLETSSELGGTVTGAGQYEAGETVTISAIANTGWIFTNWTVESAILSESTSFSYIMPNQDITLVANFIEEPSIDLPTIQTADIVQITQTTATSGGTISSDGGSTITARGVVWSTSQNPSVENNDGITNDGTGIGDFSSSLTGLSPATTYHLRAYATNSAGTAYGEVLSFNTLGTIDLPTLTTSTASNITQTTATAGGNISSAGGSPVTARGIVWSTLQNPTITNNLGMTNDGDGTGSFVSLLTNLQPSTLYYAKAYAISEAGTAYGEQISLLTLSAADDQQLLHFGQGYTWFSINVNPGNLTPSNLFAPLSPCYDDRVIGQTSFALYTGTSWLGSLTNLGLDKMYRMKLCSAQSLSLTGTAAPLNPINLAPGFTWLGYQPQECLSVSSAMAGLSPGPSYDDRVIGQNSFALFTGTNWLGSLTQMCPGAGYVIKLANPQSLTYLAGNTKGSQVISEELLSPTGAYPAINMQHTMMVVAELILPDGKISLNEKDVIYAFINGEIRGMAQPMAQSEGLIFMSIGSNEETAQSISFMVWLDGQQTLLPLNETLNFEPLAAIGDANNPFIFTLSEMVGLDETDGGIWFGEPYPNPFTEQTAIPFYLLDASHLQYTIYNSQGMQVRASVAFDQDKGYHLLKIDRTGLANGMYVIKIQTSNRNLVYNKAIRLILR